MRPDHRAPALLWDMLDAAMRAHTYVEGKSRVEFPADDLVQ